MSNLLLWVNTILKEIQLSSEVKQELMKMRDTNTVSVKQVLSTICPNHLDCLSDEYIVRLELSLKSIDILNRLSKIH